MFNSLLQIIVSITSTLYTVKRANILITGIIIQKKITPTKPNNPIERRSITLYYSESQSVLKEREREREREKKKKRERHFCCDDALLFYSFFFILFFISLFEKKNCLLRLSFFFLVPPLLVQRVIVRPDQKRKHRINSSKLN